MYCCYGADLDIGVRVPQYHGWRRAALWVSQRRFTCREGGKAIEGIFSHSPDIILTDAIYHNHWGQMSNREIDFTLRRIQQRARNEYHII